MWSNGTEDRHPHQREAVSLDRSTTPTQQRQRYFVDGPARLTSALQLISSAIGANSAAGVTATSPSGVTSPLPPNHLPHPHGAVLMTAVSRSRSEERPPSPALLAAAEPDMEFGCGENSLDAYGSSPPSPGPKTIVASDGEVSNGFVKDGQRLPYVFEASDSGKSLMNKVVR